jgi:hypothetical protein
MMKRACAVAVAFLLVSGSLIAQTPPPGCSWEGDPAFRFGWGALYAGWPGYAPPPGNYHGHGAPGNAGPDTTHGTPGAALVFKLAPYSAACSWQPAGCKDPDTFCFEISDNLGWTIVCTPVPGTLYAMACGYLWTQNVKITIPCSATPGTYDRVVGTVTYANNAGTCDVTCGDCNDPNIRPADGFFYYSKDTLFVRVDTPIPDQPPVILQDTMMWIERGQSQAHIPFSICNADSCSATDVGYHIWSLGHIGPAINTHDTVSVAAGKCRDVYGIIDASQAPTGTYDTLHIVAWTCSITPLYDTCVQRVVLIALCGDCAVPLFTTPVVTILAIALILAAALFMRRRAAREA